jgi:hypothetical protein
MLVSDEEIVTIKNQYELRHESGWIGDLQGGQEVTVHPDNTHLRLNLSLHSTAQHSTQYNVKW